MAATTTTITDSIRTGLNKIFDYIPQVIGAILILIVGFIISKILQSAVRRILRRLRFDHALHTSPAGRYIVRVVESPSALAGQITFWVVFLVFISFAASALNIQVLNYILNGIYAYLPHIIAAVIIFLVASAIAAGGAAFIQRIMGRTALAKIIASVFPAIVLSIATFMILDELRIAPAIVTITYAALMGSLALGLALAFGLGGRDHAKALLDQAYSAGQRNAGNVKAEASRASRNARRTIDDTKENLG